MFAVRILLICSGIISSNEVCSKVIQAELALVPAELTLVLAADLPMVLTDEIVEPVDGKVYLLKCFCTCNMSSLKMYIIPETTQYMFPD
jgi:hypothetical protein